MTRYWCVVNTRGDVPALTAGFFFEFSLAIPASGLCIWTIDPPLVPPIGSSFVKQSPAPTSPLGLTFSFSYIDSSSGFFYGGLLDLVGFQCATPFFTLPKFAGPPLWSDVFVYQIRWYQNADDIPHPPPP